MPGAGSAKTESFNLGAATVMIGPKEDVLDFTPEKHSIGLVKNFTFSSSDQYLDLTQGIRNTVVYSVKNGSDITASMEVYEYTPRNLAYALGLEGFELVEGADLALKEAVNGDMSTTEIKVTAASDSSASDFLQDDYVVIQGNKSSNEDLVFIGKLAEAAFDPGTAPQVAVNGTVLDLMKALKQANDGVAVLTIEKGHMKVLAGAEQTVTCSEKFKTVFGITEGERGPLTGTVEISAKDVLGTLSFANNDEVTISIDSEEIAEALIKTSPAADSSASYTLTFDRPIPEGFNFIAGDRVHKVNLIPVGSAEDQPTLAAKVVGILPEGKKPVTIIIPKLRISNGFNLSFQTDQYGNMPYEFTPMEQVMSDPLYKEYGDKGFAFVLD
jgi:hypothetical protein